MNFIQIKEKFYMKAWMDSNTNYYSAIIPKDHPDRVEYRLLTNAPSYVIQEALSNALIDRWLKCMELSHPLILPKDKDSSTKMFSFPIPQFVQNILNFLKNSWK